MDITKSLEQYLETLAAELASRQSFDIDQSVTVSTKTDFEYITFEANWAGTDIPVIPPTRIQAPPYGFITVDTLVDDLD